MIVYFATKVRGFFKHLFSNENINANFIYSQSQLYETNSAIYKLLAKIIRTPICDIFGIIQIITKKNEKCDLYGSYNRFLNTDKPYFIYVENPTALFHYSINRSNTLLGKRKIFKSLDNQNLKALVFMSKACADTFEDVCHKIPFHIEKFVIYPYVPINSKVSLDRIKSKCHNSELKLLYVAQGIRFVSKGALELIEAFLKLRIAGYINIKLTMITSIDDINISLKNKIKNINGIKLCDFKFSYEEMEDIYADSNVLLQPTSDDSYGLTILEAMKAGVPVITTKLYSIPEHIKHMENGFLTEPHYWFFDENNKPNPKVWNKRKETIYSNKISHRLVSFIYDSVLLLLNDRALLEKMSLNSYNIGNSFPFDEKTIVSQWNELFDKFVKI